MKHLINYLWKNSIIPQKLQTTTNELIEITAPGQESADGTFSNAKLTTSKGCICGNISLGSQADDTLTITITDSDGRDTTTFDTKLSIPQEMLKKFCAIEEGQHTPPCENIAATYSNAQLHDYLTHLLAERIDEKAQRIALIYESCDKRWDNTLFKLLARSFGFGIQGRPFEEWALILDLQALGKHRNSIEQVEAIMFGQAGLLNPESIPAYYQPDAMKSDYYQLLAREYKFLKSKFNLQEMRHNGWMWGNSAPHIRIARLATLFHTEKVSTTAIASYNTLKELRTTLQAQPSHYWQHHTQFGSTTTSGTACLTDKQLDILIINTIVPILYSYGKHRLDTSLCNKAEDFLYEISAENNSIVRRWTEQGMCIGCAAHSQALIQLNNAYCKAHRCTECRFMHSYLKQELDKAQ